MTRQEKIREEAIKSLMGYKGFHRAPTECIIDHLFTCLQNNGVVIKEDRELPKECQDCAIYRQYSTGTYKLLKAYVAVGPLIKER